MLSGVDVGSTTAHCAGPVGGIEEVTDPEFASAAAGTPMRTAKVKEKIGQIETMRKKGVLSQFVAKQQRRSLSLVPHNTLNERAEELHHLLLVSLVDALLIEFL